jgi:hypothetical protein
MSVGEFLITILVALLLTFALVAGVAFLIYEFGYQPWVEECKAKGGIVKPHLYDADAEGCFVKGEMVDTWSFDD